MKNLLLKLFTVFCVSSICLTSCKMVSGEKYEKEVSKNDSLVYVALQQSNEIAELSSTMNSISAQLDEINGVISMGDNNDTSLKQKRERLMEQLLTVKEKLESKQQELEDFQKKYSSALANIKELKKTIDRLNTEIEGNNAKISSYQALVTEQSKKIETLSTDLSSTQKSLEDKVKENVEQATTIDNQDKLLNEGYYIVANKSTLKDLGLVKGGVFSKTRLTTTGSFDLSSFTKIDIRNLNELPLDSKDAKILTPMPESSYELVKGIDKKITLVIKDKAAFWSQSKFLVIKI